MIAALHSGTSDYGSAQQRSGTHLHQAVHLYTCTLHCSMRHIVPCTTMYASITRTAIVTALQGARYLYLSVSC
jgi:hypothetical protein